MNKAKLQLIFNSIKIDLQHLNKLGSSTLKLISKNKDGLYNEYLKECTVLNFKEWLLNGGC